MISTKALEEYKKIYKEEFGKDISNEYALYQATNLLTLMKSIYKPITEEEYKALQKRRLETGDIMEEQFREFVKNIKYTTKKPRI